jgi:DNA repair exonuclease SbcCD nuclease subunit
MSESFTIVGDPHIRPDNLAKSEQLFDLVESLNQPVIVLGDLFDTKEVVRAKCLNLAYRKISESKLQWTLLVGNHDLFNLTTPEHSLEVLKALPNVRIIDTLMPFSGMYGIPYIHDRDQLKAELAKIPDGSIVFGHLEVRTFDYGNGLLAESGLEVKDLVRFKRVVSGHFHKFQQLDNLTYLGTPFSHSFGETNQTKYLGVYKPSTDEFNVVETHFPRHLTIAYDLNENSEALRSELAGLENDHVRVHLKGTSDQIAKFDKSQFSDLTIKWENKTSRDDGELVTLEESLDNKTQFITWATNIRKLDSETIQLGLAILESVNVK